MTTYTDKDGDTLQVRKGVMDSSKLYLRVDQHREGQGDVHTCVLLEKEVAVQLRNHILELYPVEVSPQVADVLKDVGIFFLLRQKKSDPSKVKVCWAESTTSRMFTSRARAEACAKRQNENYPNWKYFVVEKEDF